MQITLTIISKKIKSLNYYFFGEEVIHISDALWFYGVLSASILFTSIVCIPAWIS